MKFRIVLGMIVCLILACTVASAEVRTYRQFKDVATKENGNVKQSTSKGDLFEYTYTVDIAHKTVTRIKVRRLDEPTAHKDATVYTIVQNRDILGSEAGNGGHALVAVQKDGSELLELSHRFAFTARLSPFSQVITGVYKRVYNEDDKVRFHKHN
ncbi:MAG: hypothetical protein NT030_05875 [Candidatus Saganbacteria bacterium]|nr:hypothetical protein [Candidatus Saganbacteria bacterium]